MSPATGALGEMLTVWTLGMEFPMPTALDCTAVPELCPSLAVTLQYTDCPLLSVDAERVSLLSEIIWLSTYHEYVYVNAVVPSASTTCCGAQIKESATVADAGVKETEPMTGAELLMVMVLLFGVPSAFPSEGVTVH